MTRYRTRRISCFDYYELRRMAHFAHSLKNWNDIFDGDWIPASKNRKSKWIVGG